MSPANDPWLDTMHTSLLDVAFLLLPAALFCPEGMQTR